MCPIVTKVELDYESGTTWLAGNQNAPIPDVPPISFLGGIVPIFVMFTEIPLSL